jgi:glutaminyl-tRNA synthetase
VEVRDYDRLFLSEDPVASHGKDWLGNLNPNSLHVHSAVVDPSVVDLKALDRVQFERVGFYCVDPDTDVATGKYVFNRTVGLKKANWEKK